MDRKSKYGEISGLQSHQLSVFSPQVENFDRGSGMKELINAGRRSWNKEIIKGTFDKDEVYMICKIPISQTDSIDNPI